MQRPTSVLKKAKIKVMDIIELDYKTKSNAPRLNSALQMHADSTVSLGAIRPKTAKITVNLKQKQFNNLRHRVFGV